MLFENKYYLVLAKKVEEGRYQRVKRLRIWPHLNFINYHTRKLGEKTYNYCLEEVSLVEGRKNFIFKDIETGANILTNLVDSPLDVDRIPQEEEANLMKKALQTNPHDYGLAFVIIAALAGIGGGFIICVVAYPNIFPEMMKKTAKVLELLWTTCLVH